MHGWSSPRLISNLQFLISCYAPTLSLEPNLGLTNKAFDEPVGFICVRLDAQVKEIIMESGKAMANWIGAFAKYRNVTVLAFANLIAIFGYAMFNPIMSFYLYDYLRVSMFIVGLVVAIFGIVRALLQPIMGRLSDRVGRKRMIVPSLFSYAIVGCLYSAAGNAVEFVGCRALQGATSASVWPASDALVSETVSSKERARALGTVSMTYQIGTILAPSAGAVVASIWGFKEVFYVCALLAFLGAVLSLVFLTEPKRCTPRSKPHVANDNVVDGLLEKTSIPVRPDRQKDIRSVDPVIAKRRRVIVFLGLMTFLLLFTFSTVDMILSIFIMVYYGTTLIDFAVIYGVFSLIGGIAAVIGGTLADRYGKRRLLEIVTVSCVFSWLSFAFANTLTVLILLVCIFVFVATMNGPATASLLADLTPAERRGVNFGLLGLCNDLGLVAGPIAGGLVFDFLSATLGLNMLGGMQCVFILNALISLAAAVVVFYGVEEPKARY
jgi:MFS family permease